MDSAPSDCRMVGVGVAWTYSSRDSGCVALCPRCVSMFLAYYSADSACFLVFCPLMAVYLSFGD